MSNREDCDASIRDQIESALREDQERIGDVYRLWETYKDDYESIKDNLGLKTTGGVYAYLNYVNALF